MPDIANRLIAIAVDVVDGLSLQSIRDGVSQHQFLRQPASLFAFAANNGPLRHSATDLVITAANYAESSALTVSARAREDPLLFDVGFTCNREGATVIARVAIRNVSDGPVFLRLVMPHVRALATPGPVSQRRIVVPQEIGSIITADGGGPVGMPFNLDVGLPVAMNSMELASLYAADGGGIFFADIDGDLERGVSPLQFVATENDVTGFWIASIAPGESVTAPRLAIGVHHGGDWHEAVDFYTKHHRPRWTFADAPSWLRDQGAIYAFSGGGAGAILMALPRANLPDGAIWTTFETGDGPWRDGKEENGEPVQISTAAIAPAGAPIAALRRNERQVDVFVTGHDGAVWSTWEVDDGLWRDGRNGRLPTRISPPCLAPAGAPVAAVHQNAGQIDVFVAGHDGAIWVTYCTDGPWQDGYGGRLPRRITPTGLFEPGSHLAAIHQNHHQLNVFAVGTDGGIRVTWTVDDGPWRDGLDGRMPVLVTPTGFAPPGAPLATAKQNDSQLDVFVVRDDGAIWVTWEAADGYWADGHEGRNPLAVSPRDFAPLRAHLAAIKQNDTQLDVFVVRDDGAIWTTYEVGDGPWTDGIDGRLPLRVSTPELAPPGAPLSAVFQNGGQLDVFVVGNDDAIWCTWEVDNGPWRDGSDGRLPATVSTPGTAPRGAGVATVRRSPGQLDVFAVGGGRIGSFRELPRLLNEARMLGTDVVYLFDYWEGSDASGFPPYYNKGDYLLRSDLGGEAAFIDGVRAVHDAGGRIILYVEPFIIFHHSEIGHAKGDAWAGRWPDGRLHSHYPDNWTMVAPFRPWQEVIISVCERLVCLCGADGIFLDSYAWQMNWAMTTTEEGRLYTPAEHARGQLELTDRVRAAIRRHKPDAVVLGETAAGPIGRHLDAGLSAEFAWDWTREISRARVAGSPIRYAAPEIAFFTNGRDLRELHQMFAAGHGLALSSCWPGSFMFEHRDHIRRLVQIRQEYRDALIDGAQEYQPEPRDPAVVAYLYRGTGRRVLTVVNTSRDPLTTQIRLRETETDAVWSDLIHQETLATAGRLLERVTLDGGGLRLFASPGE